LSSLAASAIPQALRDRLGQFKRWQAMLSLLEALEVDTPDISDAQIHAEWDAFGVTLTTCCESAAELMIEVLVCIVRQRPEMIGTLLPDAVEPLLCLGLDDPASILQWYAEHKRLDASARRWVQETMPLHLAQVALD